MHYVYLILSEDRRYAKIGISAQIHTRFAAIQNGCPLELRGVAALACQTEQEALAIEARLHEELEPHRIRGEWFEQTPACMAWGREMSGAEDWPARPGRRPRREGWAS